MYRHHITSIINGRTDLTQCPKSKDRISPGWKFIGLVRVLRTIMRVEAHVASKGGRAELTAYQRFIRVTRKSVNILGRGVKC